MIRSMIEFVIEEYVEYRTQDERQVPKGEQRSAEFYIVYVVTWVIGYTYLQINMQAGIMPLFRHII